MKRESQAAALVGCVMMAVTGAFGQSITNIGVVPGATQSWATAVSNDGSIIAVAVQSGEPYSSHAYRWTTTGGFDDCGVPNASFLRDIGGDGSTVIGRAFGSGVSDFSFRWSTSSGLEHLPFELGDAFGINADGSVVVGQEIFSIAAMWSALGGLQELGVLPGKDSSVALDVSDNGTTVVGICTTSSSWFPVRGFVWTAEAGMQDLGVLPGGLSSYASGISGDGSVIVGLCWMPDGEHPVRWARHGIEDLGMPAGYAGAECAAANINGSVVVGSTYIREGDLGRTLVWSPHLSGPQDLRELLVSAGVDMSGWVLSYAGGVSADGRVIVGWGFYNGEDRGWVATLPFLGTCCKDFDGDGDVGTDADIGAFFACLSGSCCPACCSADFNGDGDTGTDADIESFFRVLAGGSC